MCCVLHACTRAEKEIDSLLAHAVSAGGGPLPQSPTPIRMKRSSIPGHIPSAPARPQKNHAAREQPPLQKRIRPNSAEVGRDANPARGPVQSNPWAAEVAIHGPPSLPPPSPKARTHHLTQLPPPNHTCQFRFPAAADSL
jgi:hypothetical protein